MGLKRVSWVRRYQGQCRALRPLGHQGYRLHNYKRDPPLCSSYTSSTYIGVPEPMPRRYEEGYHRPAAGVYMTGIPGYAAPEPGYTIPAPGFTSLSGLCGPESSG